MEGEEGENHVESGSGHQHTLVLESPTESRDLQNYVTLCSTQCTAGNMLSIGIAF